MILETFINIWRNFLRNFRKTDIFQEYLEEVSTEISNKFYKIYDLRNDKKYFNKILNNLKTIQFEFYKNFENKP